MKIIQKGTDPEIAVVACIHGNEPCGKKAIESFLESDINLEKSVKFVIANEEALEQDSRFLDKDLNRCFPGDKESDHHEEVLAARLMNELKGLKSLVIHSMENFEEMFCLVNGIEEDLVSAPGVRKAVDVKPLDKNSIEKYIDAVSVETGSIGSRKAEENSYNTIINFLSYFDAISKETDIERPEIFQMYDVVEGDYQFLAENFQKLEIGERFAENDEEVLEAEEPFYPILMSTNGYEKILGFKGRKPPAKNKRDEVNN
jgi:predicted deacylase